METLHVGIDPEQGVLDEQVKKSKCMGIDEGSHGGRKSCTSRTHSVETLHLGLALNKKW